MFVENLTKKQREAFVEKHLSEDFLPEFRKYWKENLLEVSCFDEPAIEVFYCNKCGFVGTVYLLDDRILPMLNRKIEGVWIQYLHDVFGEKYKEWYLQKVKNVFEKQGENEIEMEAERI